MDPLVSAHSEVNFNLSQLKACYITSKKTN